MRHSMDSPHFSFRCNVSCIQSCPVVFYSIFDRQLASAFLTRAWNPRLSHLILVRDLSSTSGWLSRQVSSRLFERALGKIPRLGLETTLGFILRFQILARPLGQSEWSYENVDLERRVKFRWQPKCFWYIRLLPVVRVTIGWGLTRTRGYMNDPK